MARYAEDWRTDQAYNFFIFAHDETLIGGVGLSNLRRGVSETASLGYWVGEPFARQRYMTSALPLVVDFAFERLGLHRLEAACLPSNIPSRSLLARAGFQQEGYAREYLCIAGKWQDHLLFAILRGDRGAPGELEPRNYAAIALRIRRAPPRSTASSDRRRAWRAPAAILRRGRGRK